MTEPTNTNLRKFGCIVADPPTEIQQRGAKRGAIEYYDLLSMEQLHQLPVAKLAKADCHLWLWSTNAALEQSFELARAWGFTPRSLFTWVKPRLGLGVYLRNATEQLIFATRGKAPVLFKGQPNWGFFPLQDHSHKPEEVVEIIRRVSPGPYLELFARRRPPSDEDWSVWGNEIDSDISLAEFGFPVPSDFSDDLPASRGRS
jgi:N6-adenosine-specific RNA methylase IME4